MRRATSVLLTMVLTLGALGAMTSSATAGEAAPAASDPSVVPGSWVVELHAGHDPRSTSASLARQHNGRVGNVYDTALSGFSFYGSDRAAANLARSPKVKRVEPNRVLHATATVPTGVQRIDSRTNAGANAITTSAGSGVSVAVLDTGVDASHPELTGRVAKGISCISSEPDPTTDGNGHGTHVSGTVAGTNVGVAPAAGIVAVKVLDSGGSGTWDTVLCGINYVTANAATIKVANMSLGGSSSESLANGCASSTLHTAICNSVNAGVTYAVASGNDGRDASGFVPAKYPEVLTVSAFSDLDGKRDPEAGSECAGFGRWKDCDETFAKFSNYGTGVDIMAPGVRIYSSVPDGYDTYSGTSMAAPHVAGVAALVLEDNTFARDAAGVAALEARLKGNGECPNATWATAAGACSGAWSGDGDTVVEPMVNATRAVANTAGVGGTSEPPPADEPPPPDADPSSYTTTTSYAGSGGPKADKHLDVTVTVTDSNGARVAGATVVADISRDDTVIWAGATGTTDSTGKVTFSLRNSGPGCYATDVATVNGTEPDSEADAGHGSCTP